MQALENAVHLIESGQTKAAIQQLDKLAASGSDEMIFTISNIYFEYDFLEKAEELLKRILNQYPNDGEIILKLSEIYIEQKRDDEAIELLSQLDKTSDLYLHALLQLADLYQTIGLYEVSESKLLEAKNIAPEEIVIDFALAEFLFSIGQETRAIPFYENVYRKAEVFNDVSINEQLAECYGSIGEYEKALAFYKKSEPDNPDALFKYGYIAAQQNEYDLAIGIWKELLALDLDYFSVYPEMARTYMALGQYEEALNIANLGIKQDEFNQELYFILAELSQYLNQDEDVLKYIQEAIQLDEENKATNLFLINWYNTHDAYDKTIDFILYLYGKNIVDPIYDWELAKAYEANENFPQAKEAYSKAYQAFKHDAEFLKQYGYFLIEEGDNQDALVVLTQYLKIEPTDTETIQFIERLKDSNSF